VFSRVLAFSGFLVAAVSLRCTGQSRWPADKDSHQASAYVADSIPQCLAAVPVITRDSLGPLHPGQPLADLERHCGQLRYAWEWGNEGIATPAVLLRFGDAAVEVEFPDTLPTAKTYRIRTESPAVRTVEGFGVGSQIQGMTRAWGAPTYGSGECVLYVWFKSRPGLSFRVRVPEAWECEDVQAVERGGTSKLPAGTTVREVLLFSPRP